MADVQVSQSKGKEKHKGKKKSKRVGVRIDMTPMVDVAFLLLTFFMLTTTMNKPQTMEINLPPSETKAEVAESNLLTLRVTEDFRLFWNVGTEKPVTVDGTDKKEKLINLGKLLKDRNRANPKLITLIKVDGKAKYIDMVDIMDELNINDITRFSLAPMLDDDRRIIGTL
ncbi:MAG: biopolymer transporter ExbD [Ignavibacteriales bacterium]|nr:biopolymer transporter ExbD [Ignavibacteriales bacterium]